MNRFALVFLFASLLFASLTCPAFADYNYNFGNSRVVVGGNGLATPSSTYIGGGTMSPSARGQLMTGAQVNPSLPNVPWGSVVGTAGDNRYSRNPIPAHTTAARSAVGSLGRTYEQDVPQATSNGLPSSKWGANIGTAGDQIRSDLNPQVFANNQKFVFRTGGQYQSVQYQPAQYTIPAGGTAVYGSGGGSSNSVHF